ncbi:MAG: thiamine-phosphate kinase, partial [Rhodoferax sp.]
LERSAVGATVDTTIAIQLLAGYVDLTRAIALFDQKLLQETALHCVLGGGDDYELVFTAPPAQRAAVQAACHASATPVTRIGKIDSEPGLRLVDAQGNAVANHFASFNHFNP